MKLITILLALFSALPLIHPRVVEVTKANVQLVVRSVQKLHLLLNHPHCPHSQSSADKYLKINREQTIGIADCSKDKQLCDYLNVTHYPSLLLVSNSHVQQLDLPSFLLANGVAQSQDQQIVLQDVLALLKDDKKWVAVVLEEQQLHIMDKVANSKEKRVMYIHSPSRLHSALKGMVGGQLGCWILVNTNSSGPLHRYYCGNGYKSQQLEKYLTHFQNGKISRYIFSRHHQSSYIQSTLLQQIVSDAGRKHSKCKLVYFYSKECQHCQVEDFELVRKLARERRMYARHDVQIFDLDREEYPKGLILKRVPELIQFCRGKMRYFDGIFTFKSLNQFFQNQNTHLPKTSNTHQEL